MMEFKSTAMDNLTLAQRHKNMQNIRSKGTRPERLVMRALHSRKLYFASHVVALPGKPDIVFRAKRVVIFVDSEFWHGHPKRFKEPATNRKYWRDKIEGNRSRDKAVNRQLRRRGWKVLRVWEHDVTHRLDRVVGKIMESLETQLVPK